MAKQCMDSDRANGHLRCGRRSLAGGNPAYALAPLRADRGLHGVAGFRGGECAPAPSSAR